MAEFLAGGNRDAKDILLPATVMEEFQQSNDLDGGHRGNRLQESRLARRGTRRDVRQLAPGDDVVQVIDELQEIGRTVVAGPGQVVLYDLAHQRRMCAAEHDDPVGHEDDLLDIMADHENRRQASFLRRPDVQDLRPQTLRREGVHLAERLVHEQDLGIDGKGSRHADPLLHAPRKLARICVLESSEPDAGDAALRALGDLMRGEPQDLEDHFHVFRDRHPRV